MSKIKQLLLLLCLITAGVQSAWANYETVTINNLKYELFSLDFDSWGSSHFACLVDILGDDVDVVIPIQIENGDQSYPVQLVGAFIENNNMKSLKFQGSIDFYFFKSWSVGTALGNKKYSGGIKSTSLQTIEFQGSVSDWDYNGARLLCPNLRQVVFSGNAPTLSGSWSNYCTAPASNVTAVVPSWTQETCEQKQLSAAVWCEFKGVVPSLDLVHDATLTSNGGGDVQIWKKKDTNSNRELYYTMSSGGGEEMVTFYGNVDSYQIRVYYDSNYEKPVLLRNGTEVTTTDAGSGYCYYNETNHMNVNSYSVTYTMKVYRKLHIVNLGNGIVRLTGLRNGVEESFTINGAKDTYWGFDKTRYVGVEITPEDGYEVQKIKHYGYMSFPFNINATTGITTTQYVFDDDEEEQALHIYYKKKTILEGTRFNLHMSVEGTKGAGSVLLGNDGVYDWTDEDIALNYFSRYELDPGESDDVIGVYDPENRIMIMDFYVLNNLDEEEAAAGLTTTVKVYANGGEVVCSDTDTEWGDYYSILLDGTDTDVRVVYESNGRYLTGDNGNGGSVAVYREGSNMPVGTTYSGSRFWDLIPKTGSPYVVITPIVGKTVTAVFRNGKLLSSLSTYLQGDGTYRIPLEGFDKGDSYYPLYIVYGDDLSSIPVIEWSLQMLGDMEVANNENLRTNVKMMLDGDEVLSATEDISLSQTTLDLTDYDTEESVVAFYVYVKPGQTFEASFNCIDVADYFVRDEDHDQNGLLCYAYTTEGFEQFAADGTWVVVFKKAGLTWNAVAMGAPKFCVDIESDGEPIITDLDSEENISFSTGAVTPEQVELLSAIHVYALPGYTFTVKFNDIDLTGILQLDPDHPWNGMNYYRCFSAALQEYLSLLSTDGTWVVEYKKDDVLTQSAIWVGDDTDKPLDVTIELYDDEDHVLSNFTADSSHQFVSGSAEKSKVEKAHVYVTVATGYTYKVFFNGQEVTGFTLDEASDTYKSYDIILEDASYLQDGQWVILFYDDADRYDVNHDGEVNVSDVTALVNKILHP
ncbi:MAG: hypothetical protein J6T94_03530 [Bacteroidaceae bacterium]|nr:hypothetical protein [Bacteroidaceae bacterium]